MTAMSEPFCGHALRTMCAVLVSAFANERVARIRSQSHISFDVSMHFVQTEKTNRKGVRYGLQ